jgi:acetyl esterase/lipase
VAKQLYMIVEHFKGNAVAIYARFRDRGRMAPDGLIYISSWVDEKLERCYQLMEAEAPALIEEWMMNWRDLADFEVHEVMSSREAAERIAPSLPPRSENAG